jgi:hypothetical protein
MLRRTFPIRADVSEELSTSIIRVTRIGELVPPKHVLLQEPHGVTSQRTPFFIGTAVKTTNLTPSIYVSPLMSENMFDTHT